MTSYYWNEEKQKIVEGYPPDKRKVYGQAPNVIFDSMPKTYHPKADKEVESRSEWNMLDKMHGTITFGSKESARPRVDQANEAKRRRQEIRKASQKALQAYKENPTEVKQKLQKQGEQQIETLKISGLDKDLNKAGIIYDN